MAATGNRSDPFPAFNFYISLSRTSSKLAKVLSSVDVVVAGGFTECSGLEGTLEIEEYSEGGENSFVHKFPKRMTYPNLVLKRGLGFSQELWRWHYDYVIGKGQRVDVLITQHDESQKPVRSWAFKEGLPLKWTGPTFNATQNAVAIETLEIAHHGWKPLPLQTSLQELGQAVGQVGQAIGGLF